MPRRRWTKFQKARKRSSDQAMCRRLEHDRDLVCRRYPSLVFSCDLNTRRLVLTGTLRLVEEDTGQPTDIQILLSFPPNYPAKEPTVYEVGGRFERIADRHINSGDGSFCLWLAPLSRWDSSDPDALLVLLDRVSVFCEDQLTYEVAKRFPHGDWAHGDAGYAEFLFESLGSTLMDALVALGDIGALPTRNELCLCSSGLKFKRCHMASVERALAKLGSWYFQTGLDAWKRGEWDGRVAEGARRTRG